MRALATADRLGLTRYVSQQIQYSLLQRELEAEFCCWACTKVKVR